MTAASNSQQRRQSHYSLPDYDSNGELPLHLIALPPLCTNDDHGTSNNNDNQHGAVDMLAYGGGDGHIYLLPNYSNNNQKQQAVDSSSLSNDNSNNKGDMTSSKLTTPILLASYDDIPRSMAVSSDGLRLVIGFESGETRVFFYDDNDDNNEGNVDKLGVAHHPFVDVGVVDKAIDKANGDDSNDNSGDDSEDDDNGGFFTQSQEQSTTKFFHGPRSELAIRQLAFDPRSSSTTKEYYLAIGSESGDTPLRVVNVYDEETASKWFLEGEGGDVHGGAGVRSVAYSTTVTNNKSSGEEKQWLTTLGMDGKLTVWDVSSPLSLPEEWEHVHSDFVVSAKPDTGSLGSDAADKACQLVWGQVGGKSGKEVELVVLPGKTDVQVRAIPQKRSSGEEYVECFKKQQFVMDLERGHKDTIVVMAFEPVGSNGGGGGASRKVVTAARDGKLLLWELTCDEEDDDDDSKSVVVVGGSLVKELSMVRGTAARYIK